MSDVLKEPVPGPALERHSEMSDDLITRVRRHAESGGGFISKPVDITTIPDLVERYIADGSAGIE